MLRSLFVITLLGAGFIGSLWSRHIALLTYVWIALFRPVEWIWWDISAMRPSLLAGWLLLLPCLISGQFPNASHPLTVGMWLFTGAVFVAQLTSYVAGSWASVDQFVRLALVCGLAVTLLNTRQRVAHYVAVLGGSIAFFSAKGGVVSMMNGGVAFGGQAGSFVDNNGYALAVAMAIPLMAAASSNLRFGHPLVDQVAKWGFKAAIPLSVFAIIGTMSRGGLVALGAVSLVFALLQRRPVLWSAGIVLAGFLAYRYAPMPEGYLERIETIQTYQEEGDQSAISRLHFWRVAEVMARANPLGVGLRQFDRAYDDYDFLNGGYGRRRSVHSSHFQVLAELGYFGIAVWVALLGYGLAICVKVRYRATRAPWLSPEERRFYVTTAPAFAASLIAFIVGGSFIALANNDLTWMTFAGIAAMQRTFVAQKVVAAPVSLPVSQRAAPVRPRRKAIA
jgi:putative inorganic carbon (HCO3(-)) transporter